ncbi:MAG: hypothetical protein LBT92_03595 [Rickettsiales bacterium]|jgi:hypothetical protein|nr:hypothetical protein [Rickettsiales bacterium]
MVAKARKTIKKPVFKAKAKPSPMTRAAALARNKARRYGLMKFITDAFEITLNPVRHFSGIKADGHYDDAILKILMYGLVAAGIKILFSIADITFLGAATSAVVMPVIAVFISFGLAGIMLFFSFMTKGEVNFESALKAVASCIFLYPVAYAAYHLAFAYWVLFFFSLAIDLYIVFLLYVATTVTLKGEEGLAKMVFGIFAAAIAWLHLASGATTYMMYKNPGIIRAYLAK